jgi:hypothetical protein
MATTSALPPAKVLKSQNAKIIMAKRPGLYENIRRKRERIEDGSEERMRKPGAKGAPSAADFRNAAKTAKKKKKIN